MRGSYSLKRVMPAMVPEYAEAYSNLAVGGGSEASASFLRLLERAEEQEKGQEEGREEEEVARQRVRRHLLEYCALDTLALVKVLEQLVLLARGEGE